MSVITRATRVPGPPPIVLPGAPALAVGAFALGGLIGYALSPDDGSRRRSRYAGRSTYTVHPKTRSEAERTLQFQRVFAGVKVAAGAVGAVASLANPQLGTFFALGAAGLAGWGVGELIKLDGAEGRLGAPARTHHAAQAIAPRDTPLSSLLDLQGSQARP